MKFVWAEYRFAFREEIVICRFSREQITVANGDGSIQSCQRQRQKPSIWHAEAAICRALTCTDSELAIRESSLYFRDREQRLVWRFRFAGESIEVTFSGHQLPRLTIPNPLLKRRPTIGTCQEIKYAIECYRKHRETVEMAAGGTA